VTNRAARATAVIICLIILVLPAALSACRNPDYIYSETGAVECGADGRPIVLDNNPDAADPTFIELMDFIARDATDQHPYVDGEYVCADFAEDVHNNAEAAGIRAGWVGINFDGLESGHAVNIFETTDRGTVYIDCTNGSNSDPAMADEGRDMIAYLEVGKTYGVIPVDQIIATGMDYYPLTYDYYAEREAAWETYTVDLESYNESVAQFNAETSARTYTIGSAAYRKMTDWKRDLINQANDLKAYQDTYGDGWYQSEYSSYTVKEISVHW
jgi:hypothetical protein